MALKALDQRLANNASPGPSSATPNGVATQSPRPPPIAAAPRPDAPAMPSAAVAPNNHVTKKSVGEVDVGESENSDSR